MISFLIFNSYISTAINLLNSKEIYSDEESCKHKFKVMLDKLGIHFSHCGCKALTKKSFFSHEDSATALKQEVSTHLGHAP